MTRQGKDVSPLLIALASLLATVVFFAPHLWLMRHYVPGSFEWDRAHTYLLQCENPLRRDIEPAMLWRILPPFVCHVVRLPGNVPLVVPWIGVISVLWYVARLAHDECSDWRFVAGTTTLFATTSAILVPIGWLGMNDSWVWLGLIAVAFSRHRRTLALACLLAPWVDERFIIGFPLAWAIRRQLKNAPWSWPAASEALWVLPYAVLRLWLGRHDAAASSATHRFLIGSVRQTAVILPLAPLGWWMGLRAGWIGVVRGVWSPENVVWRLTALALGTMVVCLALAADLSRSIAIITPLMLLGCIAHVRRMPLEAPRQLLRLGLVNLLIPAAHVTCTHIVPISPLPIEIIRLFRAS